jgi:hypothetical protein
MGWLDRLLGREKAEAEAAPSARGDADDESQADVLEEGAAAQRDEDALRNPHPGVG